MTNPENFRLRVFYRKAGRLAMLSHLEVARALERTVRRAGLPYAISQGFSPHMKIAFGAALPVGVGGARECFDLQLTRYIAPDEIYEQLFVSSVPDLLVLSCEYIGHKAPAASVAYPVSTYRAVLSQVPEGPLAPPEEVTVVRKKKQKTLEVKEFLQGEPALEGNILEFSLIAKPTGSLRPDIFLQELLKPTKGITPVSITRIRQGIV